MLAKILHEKGISMYAIERKFDFSTINNMIGLRNRDKHQQKLYWLGLINISRYVDPFKAVCLKADYYIFHIHFETDAGIQ